MTLKVFRACNICRQRYHQQQDLNIDICKSVVVQYLHNLCTGYSLEICPIQPTIIFNRIFPSNCTTYCSPDATSLFMTFTSAIYGKRSLNSPPSGLTSQSQSTETKEVVPGTAHNGGPITKNESVAKPWAHFVAGGYPPLEHLSRLHADQF